jgi:hypothetical protein
VFGTLTGISGQTLTVTGTASNGVTSANVSAGTQALTTTGLTLANGSGLASNYQFASSGNQGTITARALTVTGVTATNKVYDATTAAAVDVSGATLTGVIGSDMVSVSTSGATGAFDTKNVGTGKTVAIAGLSLGGADAGNYTLTGTSATTNANITARALTVTAATSSKTYDATTASSATPTITSGALQGLDTASFTQTFDTKNVGTGKTLTASGTVSGDGNSGNNYSYTFVTVATGTITARALTVTAATSSKTYDATTASSATPTITAGALQGSDTASFTQAFDTQNVGTGKTLTASGTVSDGNSGANYSYTFVTAATGTITARALTVTASDQSKTYGDTVTFGAGSTLFTSSGLVNSETIGSVTLAVANSGGTAAANVGSYAITPSAANGGTFTASNYSIAYAAGALTVNPATLTYTANTVSQTYGTAIPSLSGSVSGFVLGQTQATATTGTLSFSTAAVQASNVGNYAINGSGLTANNGNYTFVHAAGNSTALTINPATLTLMAKDATKIFGQTLTFAGTEFTISGLLSSDALTSARLTSAGATATAAAAGSPYQIVASSAVGSGLTNYNIVYVNGILTVNPAANPPLPPQPPLPPPPPGQATFSPSGRGMSFVSQFMPMETLGSGGQSFATGIGDQSSAASVSTATSAGSQSSTSTSGTNSSPTVRENKKKKTRAAQQN